MKTLGIVTHSAEGGSLCFLTACRHGGDRLGAFMHPTIVMSAVPMALSMPAWESGDHDEVGRHLGEGVRRVADAGADFYVCPDNTAHIVLEKIAETLPIPGLHIAEVVCREIAGRGWRRAGLLGTTWTMTGPVYERAMARQGLERLTPDGATMGLVNGAIFGELCRGVFTPETRAMFVRAIEGLRDAGAECVVLGCTEIPLIVGEADSALPVIDSTRLLARCAVDEAIRDGAVRGEGGWVRVSG